MRPAEKDAIMDDFKNKKLDILVSTTVIEVGVNVPNATLMIIENAERFGLAQLHQLRGRVGRGNNKSYCILIYNSKTEVCKERMAIMEETTDGFKISQKDLEIRGPGEFFGTRQHGLPELKVANIFKYEYVNNSNLVYEEELDFNINLFSEFVSENIDNTKEKIYEYTDGDKEFDVFIDFSGLKYEWNKIIVDKITKVLDENSITYWISNRYLSGYSVDTDLKKLKNSNIYLTCYDENEPDIDSTILQGFAYYNKLNVIGYESNPVKYYVEGEQEFGVTLMLEQSCTTLTKNVEETINKIINNIKYI